MMISSQVQVNNFQKNISLGKRINSIEFLRILLIYLIILLHIFSIKMQLCQDVSHLFNSKKQLFLTSGFAVEFFFIIGGYFLYENIKKGRTDPHVFINNIYIRLAPVFMLSMFLCMSFGSVDVAQILPGFLLLTGLSLPGQIIDWGDWFVGVYFWLSIVFFVLLHKQSVKNMFWVLIIVYFSLSVKLNLVPQQGLIPGYLNIDGNFYGFIGAGVVRGLGAVGVGILASFIQGYISIPHNKKFFYLFSVSEFILFFTALCILTRPTEFNIVCIQLVFAVLLLSFVNSAGVLSVLLNKIDLFSKVGKYSFSIYLLHLVPLKFFKEKNVSDIEFMLLVLIGATVLGIISYHIVEKPLTQKLKMKYA